MSLRIIAIALQKIAARPTLDNEILNCFRDIDGLQIQVSLMISEINAILEDVLKKRQDTTGPMKPIVSKRAWLWKKKYIEKKRAQIRDMMTSLAQLTLLLSNLCPWSVI